MGSYYTSYKRCGEDERDLSEPSEVTEKRTLHKNPAMAKPIEPTPTLRGKDAERLLRDLKNVCSPEEARARSTAARDELKEMMRPKGHLGGADPQCHRTCEPLFTLCEDAKAGSLLVRCKCGGLRPYRERGTR